MTKGDLKVLVTDDVMAMREYIRQLLTGGGYKNVAVSENGPTAIETIKKQKFDLIIGDWHLSGKDGLMVLKFLRTHPDHYHVPFVMVTAEDTREQVIMAIACGADDYLIKPVTVQSLSERLDALLVKKGMLK